MQVGDKFYLRTNLQKAVYIAQSCDRDVRVAEQPARGNWYPQSFAVLRSMLLTPDQRVIELAKRHKNDERARKHKRDMKQDGYRGNQ